MKKISVLLLALTSILALAPLSNVKANAAEEQTIFMEEQFEDDQLSTSKWKMDLAADSMKLASMEDSGHLKIPYNVEEYHLTTAEKIENLQSFQFDFFSMKGTWTAMYFTGTFDNYCTPNGNAFFEYFYDNDGNLIQGADGHDWNGIYKPDVAILNDSDKGFRDWGTCRISQNTYAFEEAWYTILFEVTSPITANLYCAPQGEDPRTEGTMVTVELKAPSAVPHELDYDFENMYIELACTQRGLQIDNLKIVSDNVNVDENFNDPDLDPAIVGFELTDEMEPEIVKANSYLSIERAQAGDSIIYSAPIPKDTSKISSLETIKAGFNVSFADAQADDELAFVFGVSPDTLSYADGCYAVRFDKTHVWFAKYANGQWLSLSPKTSINELKNDTPVVVTVNKNGTVSVLIKDTLVVEYSVNAADYYVGHFGFMTPKANGGNIMLDKVKANTTKYQMPVSKSVYHNFSNDFFGNVGYEDFVMNSVGGTQTVKDGKLVWEGISDYSYFGSAHQYDDFVLDYTISAIYSDPNKPNHETTMSGSWLGLDVGKSINTETQYGSNVTLILNFMSGGDAVHFTPYSNDGNVTAGQVAKGFKKHKDIPMSYFTAIQYNNLDKMESDISDGDAVCIRFVAESNTVRLYMKKACEAEYTLYYTVDGVETMGYTALCCSGYLFMSIDDFAMSNISGSYTTPDPYEPDTQIVVEKEIIYDRGNVDVNGLEEALLNMDSAQLQELFAGMDDETVKQILANAGIDTATDTTDSTDEGGCGSQINAAYAMVPVLLAGCFLIYKQTKRREEK